MQSQRTEIRPEELSQATGIIQRINSYFGSKVVGQSYLGYSLLVSLMTNGHILLESVPGLAKTTAAQQFEIPFSINAYIIGKYSPGYGMFVSALLEWICFVWIALCIYLCNVLIKKGAGILAAGLFIFLDIMIYNSWTPWAYRFSPITLAQLSNYNREKLSYGITLNYTWCFYGITIVCFIIGIICARRRNYHECN